MPRDKDRKTISLPDGKSFRPSKGKAWAKPFRISSGIVPNKQQLQEIKAHVPHPRDGQIGLAKRVTAYVPSPDPNKFKPAEDKSEHKVRVDKNTFMHWSGNDFWFVRTEEKCVKTSRKYKTRRWAMFYYSHYRIEWREVTLSP